MQGKARENLEAGLLLLEAGLVNAAASRLYYALFQAAVYALERQGKTPARLRRGARRWDHRMVGERASLVRGLAEDAVLFDELRDLRGRADYESSPVERRKVEFMKQEVERFVREVTT